MGVIVLFLILTRYAKVNIFFKRLFSLPFAILRKILSVGLPSAGENLLWMAQYMVAFGFVASMGEASLNVQTIYFQITLLILLCGASISVANEVIVGHLVGAMRFDGRSVYVGREPAAGILSRYRAGHGDHRRLDRIYRRRVATRSC